MNMKKCSILLLIGAVVIGMSAVTASAEEEPIPDVEIEHDASNGERGLDIVDEEDNPDDALIIAPNPDDDQLIIAPAPDSDSKETAVLASATENDEVATVGLPVLGVIGIIASLAIAAVVINKRK